MNKKFINTSEEFIILVAEDDLGYIEIIRWQLKEAGLNNEIKYFHNGYVLWNFLSKTSEGSCLELNQSYLLLLDIRMPKMDGFEVLRKIRQNENLKNIPVIMLSTTDNPHEIEECYKLGCNSYLTKPIEINKLIEILNLLGFAIKR